MVLLGFKGLVSFWNTIYVLPGYENNQRLINHEKCHLEQIKSDGATLFFLVYLFWLFQYGYYDNLYEVEAREAEYKAG